MVEKVRSKAYARATAVVAMVWKPGFGAAVLLLACLALPPAALLSAPAQAAQFEGENDRPPVTSSFRFYVPQGHDGTPFEVSVFYPQPQSSPPTDITATNATVTNVAAAGNSEHSFKVYRHS